MIGDEIVREVRRVREAYAARFNFDLMAIYRDLKEKEKKSGRKYLNLSSKTKAKKKSASEARHQNRRTGASHDTIQTIKLLWEALENAPFPELGKQVGGFALYDSLLAGTAKSVLTGSKVKPADIPLPDEETREVVKQIRK